MAERSLFPGRSFSAFLFDMDGTILTSILAAERVWTKWAVRHGLDVGAFLPTMHGRRAIETVRNAVPDADAELEAAQITLDEIADVDGIAAIDGAAAFLASLPRDRWAIVTSASRALAEARLLAAGLPWPPMLVSSEDVLNGKPAPDCFLLAAERLGFPASECLVFEDAAAGIAAAESAGAAVVVITATHTHPLAGQNANLPGYAKTSVRLGKNGSMELVATV